MAALPPEYTCGCFDEISQGYTEDQAQREATRCLNCGVCSECMQCVEACQAGAIDHTMQPETTEVEVGAVILSPGFQTFNPTKCGTYHYDKLSQRGDLPGVRADSLGLRPLRRPPGAALGSPGTQEDRLAPVRGLPGREVPHLLLLGLLHVRHQGGGDRQGARPLRAGSQPSSSWTCAPSARTSSSITIAPKTNTGCVSSVPGSTASIPCRVTIWPSAMPTKAGKSMSKSFDMIVLSVGMEVSQAARELAADPGGGHQRP